ncbi:MULTISPECIES: potassium-transporting ATPase subunit KdpC [Cryobacterium]|uniref:Potassium-transporting ATPase KdpC subunit n=1 Tax=Cryobacterium glucosi TaxID=1259175 RepID=A0ABY2IT09_9MICO|nr:MULTISPECIES: potassium-transporting ATPase subunit KdpC [Cryobacterium]TFC00224.1 potassium-transporting ATPase subunit KdpC [Cryobacterium sp. MDB2-A-1]TFC10262.1 potassium-transporting ATPase subunit KdpC [Cryobacterium sp. MDB2-33-2]TFC13291.1 potassium-transporting ATPase subunit KdpC [Cryobacterium sp. MDB2-10]TFC14088.1 potassium-transporting ATPase subunit KdpC [Cryobacterium sp. MDB2-A-2]TFC22410.1 potassium-transporting ATPase subunit KdpC [Cryobacterium glucosi]
MSSPRSSARQYGVALRAMLVFTVILGVAYPLAIMAFGQVALPNQANGSLIQGGSGAVGSSLIGQSFTDAQGAALPEWFQSRPSAAGDGYDAAASGGSNLGPENADLIAAIADRTSAIEGSDGVTAAQIPADALTASASGLDPQISAEYARIQVNRVSAARGLPVATVSALVESRIQGRDLGFLGEPTVNVLQLNLALAALPGQG